jgi:hypothetical protein
VRNFCSNNLCHIRRVEILRTHHTTPHHTTPETHDARQEHTSRPEHRSSHRIGARAVRCALVVLGTVVVASRFSFPPHTTSVVAGGESIVAGPHPGSDATVVTLTDTKREHSFARVHVSRSESVTSNCGCGSRRVHASVGGYTDRGIGSRVRVHMRSSYQVDRESVPSSVARSTPTPTWPQLGANRTDDKSTEGRKRRRRAVSPHDEW